MNENAILVVSIDGFVSSYSGVGALIRNFFGSYDRLSAAIPSLVRCDLYGACPDLRRSEGFSEELMSRTKATCESFGGRLMYLDTLADHRSTKEEWSAPNSFPLEGIDSHSAMLMQWEAMSCAAATLAIMLGDVYRRVLVIAHEIPFASLSRRLQYHDSVIVLHVPHAFGVQTSGKYGEVIRRYEYQEFPRVYRSGYVAYINDFSKEILLKSYSAPEGCLVRLRNGILKRDVKPITDAELYSLGVPDEVPIVFAWGRGDPTKNFHATINFVEALNNRDDRKVHLLLLAPPNEGDDDYVATLRQSAERNPDITILTTHDSELPLAALQSPRVIAAVFASLLELAPLVALEALRYRHANLRILYLDAPYYDAFSGQAGCRKFSVAEREEMLAAFDSVNLAADFSSEASLPGDFISNYAEDLCSFITKKFVNY